MEINIEKVRAERQEREERTERYGNQMDKVRAGLKKAFAVLRKQGIKAAFPKSEDDQNNLQVYPRAYEFSDRNDPRMYGYRVNTSKAYECYISFDMESVSGPPSEVAKKALKAINEAGLVATWNEDNSDCIVVKAEA